MSLTVSFRELSKLTPAERGRLLVRSEAELGTVMEKAKPIIAAVKAEGDEALARFAREFDKSPVTADRLKATPADSAAIMRCTRTAGGRGAGDRPCCRR